MCLYISRHDATLTYKNMIKDKRISNSQKKNQFLKSNFENINPIKSSKNSLVEAPHSTEFPSL